MHLSYLGSASSIFTGSALSLSLSLSLIPLGPSGSLLMTGILKFLVQGVGPLNQEAQEFTAAACQNCLEIHIRGPESQTAVGLCLLIWQETFHFTIQSIYV